MIYADYNGSSPLIPEVVQYLERRLRSHLFANPNAIHSMGQKINTGIEKCREIIAEVVECHPDQLIFTSGSSEGISTIFKSILSKTAFTKKKIVLSSVEHAAVLKVADYYKDEEGFEIISVPVSREGIIDLDFLQETIRKEKDHIALVCIMYANNETGVIQPIDEIASLVKKYLIPFISDTTQVIGKHTYSFEKSGLDYAVASSHKFGALIGSGFIIAKNPTTISPIIFGGGQEKGLRGGTQNYLAIETMAIALKTFKDKQVNFEKLNELRFIFEKKLKDEFTEIVIFSHHSPRLIGTSLIAFPGIHGQALQIELESQDIFVTTSAACSDNQPETSHVLKSMKVSDEIGRGVIRISLGIDQDEVDYEKIFQAIKKSYKKLKKIQY